MMKLTGKSKTDIETEKLQKFIIEKCKEAYEILLQRNANGFEYEGYHIQCDPIAMQNMNGFLTASQANLLTYPIVWRTKENINIKLKDETELQKIAKMMLLFVQNNFYKEWEVKDKLRSSTSLEEAQIIWDKYINSLDNL